MSNADPLPVVALHGIIGTDRFLPFAGRLAPHRSLIPDLLGYGAHVGAPALSITIQNQAAHVLGAMSRAGMERAHVVGHSVGGVIAVALTAMQPARVASIVNIEGNFTLRDAFWSSRLAAMPSGEADAMLHGFRTDPADWLQRAGVVATTERIEIARDKLFAQPASTLQTMAKSVVDATAAPAYLDSIRTLLGSGIPMHLVAGERSRRGWDVPDFVLAACASYTEMSGVGHLMNIEAPDAYVETIRRLVSSD